MAQRGPAGSLGDLLAARRRHRFVGRVAEVELFRVALESPEPPFALLYLYGPPGIGKTRLLDVLAGLAADAGVRVLRLDGRNVPPSPPAVLQALGVAEMPDDEEAVLTGLADDGRLVVLLDAYERLGPLDDWLRTWFLPRLPASSLTVVAGRPAPGVAWRADPAWRELLRVVSLRNLSPQESREYLHACGVDVRRHDQLVELAHGHPLGLSLLVDVVVRGGGAATDPLGPDLVGALLRRFIEIAPDGVHRRALEVLAVARVTTEGLLRETLGVDDAHEPFEWLRGLCFVEAGPDGVHPHDLARDVLDADLRWRDPERYAQVFRQIRGQVNRHLEVSRGRAQQRAIADAKYLFRRLPGVLSPVDWEAWGEHYPEPARKLDGGAILDLVLTWEGQASAAIAARWWELQPDGFFVIRGQNGVVDGFLALLDLTRASAQDIASDSGAAAAWEHATGKAPPRPHETITMTRFIIDSQAYQGPSVTLNATPILTMQRYLGTPNLAWDFLTLAEPERWEAYFAAADMPRVTGADFWVDGRRYGLFGHDFRRVPVSALLEVVTERALAQDAVSSSRPVDPPPLLLSQQEFDDSVRQALRDLRRPDLLARNPLLRTRLVRERSEDALSGSAAVQGLLHAAVDALRTHPRDDSLWRAVDRTYVHPAASQERAAAALGVPFSTYRRHLTQGVSRVVAWLWDKEVYGSGEPA
jgi:hypothetical protein